MVDQGLIDRVVVAVGSRSVGLARRMDRVDRAGTTKSVEVVGRGVDASGQQLQGVQPRTLQHDLLVIVFWLAVALGFFYWFA